MEPKDQDTVPNNNPSTAPEVPQQEIVDTATSQEAVESESTVTSVESTFEPTSVKPEDAPTIASSPASIGLPPMVSPGEQKPAKKRISKKVKIIALIVFVAVFLIAGSVGAYFGIVVPGKPQRIVQDSLVNTVNVKKTSSAKFEGEVTCVSGEACKMMSALLFKGSGTDKGVGEVNLQLKTAVTTISLDARSTGDKSLYLRLSGLNGLDSLMGGANRGSASLFGGYDQIIEQINNQWYTIDESLIKQGLGDSVPTEGLSESDTKQIGEIYKKHPFITVNKKLGNEKIHDQDSYHLQVTIDKTQFKAFANDVKNANIKSLNSLKDADINMIDKADFSKYPVDLWVSKSDRKITQIAMTLDDNQLSGETKLKLRLALYDYNKGITVEKPAGAKSVLELVSELSAGMGGQSNVRGANSDSLTSLLGL